MNDGMEEKEAKQRAEKKLKEEDLKELLKQYGILIKNIMRIRYGPIHKTIMKSISEFVDDGYEKGKSIRMALRKYRHLLEELLEEEEEEEEQEEEEEEEQAEEEEEEQEEEEEEEEESL